MTDLSMPPLGLVLPPLSGRSKDQPAPAKPAAFSWPVPLDTGHGVATPMAGPEPAELEGPNGTVTLCRLLAVNLSAQTIQVQTGSARGPLTLKLTQFRRITLLRPLKPLGDGQAKLRGRLQLARITFRDGHSSEVKSVGTTELPIGHFTFSPLNGQGHLLRTFYPRPMVTQLALVDLVRPSVDKVLAAAAATAKAAAPASASLPAQAAGGGAGAGPVADLAIAARMPAPATESPAATTAREPDAGGLSLKGIDDLEPPAAKLALPPAGLPSAPGATSLAGLASGASSGPSSTLSPAPSPAPAFAPGAGKDSATPPAIPRLADALPPLDFAPMDAPEVGKPAATRPAMARASDPPVPAESFKTRTTVPPHGLARLPELTEVVTPPDAAGAADSAGGGARSLTDILQAHQISTPPQLLEAIERQARMPMVRIGEALMALGYITEQKLGDALQAQSRDRSLPLGELLVRRGDVSRANLQTALARKMGYPVVNVSIFPTDSEAIRRLPLSVARRLPALPLMFSGGRLVVAMEDPSARNVIDEIEFSAQSKIVPVLARAGTLLGAIENAYLQYQKETIDPGAELALDFHAGTTEVSADKLLADLELDSHETTEDGPTIEQSDNSLVRLINSMILEARQMGVSDIHIECPPPPHKVKVRFRRDGVLRPYLELPPGYRQAMVARIKIMCDLDISERRKPQDGKISFGRFMQGHKLELRVATIPTSNGLEDVVLRLLSGARALPLDGMNIAPDVLEKLRRVVERPYGLVLCVGPTGSGKTTTLHAALAHINTPERKIWTAEDPVEISQPGLRQVQVNPKIDWTFAKALRALLRADPDVVMVGEVRDEETAHMAIEASLTGHLVMSTLHTNSAAETVTRLLDMGMDPFSFADSLLAVLAQRLVRRWCRECMESRPASDEWVEELAAEYLYAYPDADGRPMQDALLAAWRRDHGRGGVLMQHHAPGCPKCNGSGYEGRVGLHEMLVVSRELRHMVQQKAPAMAVQRQAMEEGMRLLRQDGILKVLAGLTSIEEVRAISNL